MIFKRKKKDDIKETKEINENKETTETKDNKDTKENPPKEKQEYKSKQFDLSTLGEFIASVRKEKGLSQDDIAKALYIDKRKVSRWETNASKPEFEIVPDLAKVLGISIDELYDTKTQPKEFIEKFKYKINSAKKIRYFERRQKFLLILAILLGIFFGLTTIYTILNYDTVEVYSINSIDNNFLIKGNYIKAKDYQLFNVTDLLYLNQEDEKLLDINVYNLQYTIVKNKKDIFKTYKNDYSPNNKPKLINLLNTINSSSFNYEGIINNFTDNDDLIFRISYRKEDYTIEKIDIKFKLVKEFDNKF